MKNSAKNVSEAVRQLRESLQISQSEMGKRIGGVTGQTVFRYESGSSEPRSDTLLALARLALERSRPDLLRHFLEPIAVELNVSIFNVIVLALLSTEESTSLPDSRSLARIAKRAAELLGE